MECDTRNHQSAIIRQSSQEIDTYEKYSVPFKTSMIGVHDDQG